MASPKAGRVPRRLESMPPHPHTSLPIYATAPAVVDHLRNGRRLVLTAPTGSGKTTQIPQIILHAGLTTGQIIVLQPRRLATRLVANRVAAELGTPVGELVGYQTRHESRISPQTRIRFMTEGLFIRLMQAAPTLPGVGCVILDEFHERSLQADVALALLKGLQEGPRPDLRLVVMSATLETAKVAQYLEAPTLEAHGRMHPVDISYLPHRPTRPIWEVAAQALADLLHAEDPSQGGDVLIFMPGLYEIRRTLEACRRVVGSAAALYPLHGDLSAQEQDAAVALAAEGRRKVIVATNVAETSITIPGVRHVIDSGLARVNRYDPRRGINVLLIEPIACSSADQRAGRAGRTAPGTCRRLWTQQDQRTKPLQQPPEVLRLDLAEVLLQLHALGSMGRRAAMPAFHPRTFAWLDRPTDLALDEAESVLQRLEALDATGQLTATGRALAHLPMHPRLARMVLQARRLDCVARAGLWAAFVSERDILLPRAGSGADRFRQRAWEADFPSDLLVLEAAFAAARAVGFDPGACASLGINAHACREVERTAALYARVGAGRAESHSSGGRPGAPATRAVQECLLAGFPEHVGVYKGAPHHACELVGQRRGVLAKESVARWSREETRLILALEVCEIGSGTPAKHNVRTELGLASVLNLELLREVFPRQVQTEIAHVWNEESKGVERIERTVYTGLVLESHPRGQPDPAQAGVILAQKVLAGELRLEGWDERVEGWIARVHFAGRTFPQRRLLTYGPQERQIIVEEICAGCVRFSQVRDKPCLEAVQSALSWEDRQFVEKMAPEALTLPNGRKMKLQYPAEGPPHGRSKIQDFYDVQRDLTVAGGRVKVLLEILGPNFRPVQVTDDLPGFWQRLYPTLKKELQRRYPRHEWR